MPEDVKAIAADVSTLPRRLISKLPLGKANIEKIYRSTGQIEAIAHELVYPGAPDNLACEIDL